MGVVPGLQAEPVILVVFPKISHHIMTAAVCSCSLFLFSLFVGFFSLGKQRLKRVEEANLGKGLSLSGFPVSGHVGSLLSSSHSPASVATVTSSCLCFSLGCRDR